MSTLCWVSRSDAAWSEVPASAPKLISALAQVKSNSNGRNCRCGVVYIPLVSLRGRLYREVPLVATDMLGRCPNPVLIDPSHLISLIHAQY